jgi:inorganic pyrophosphatase
MVDSGAHDGKLLCVPDAGKRYENIRSIRQIASNQLEDVAEFFRTYKSLEGRVTEITGWLDVEAVPALLERCVAAAAAQGAR